MSILIKLDDAIGWCIKHIDKPSGLKWSKNGLNYVEVVCTRCGKRKWLRE